MKSNRITRLKWFVLLSFLHVWATPATAQSPPITSAPDGTGTQVNQNGNRFDISGGSLSGDQSNLFHSFQRFGLSEGQIANFLSSPSIRNILGRVTGGDVSIINGLIQVTGGNSNLYLMNPAGIIFGANASLNVPASFTATTATGIGFNQNWFSAIGNNNWSALVGSPNIFAFTNSQSGSLVNAGHLAVSPGQSLSLIGGTVINTGQLTAPSGSVILAAVPGENLVRLSQSGHLLSLEIQPTATATSDPENLAMPVLSLPELLTGNPANHATGLTVNDQGQIVLTGNTTVATEPGMAIVAGTVNVAGEFGGSANIFGQKIGVINGVINAAGVQGGGQVLIGGEYRGLGTVPNAERTFISLNSLINADAIQQGNGGRVIVWADDMTRFYGTISARGGAFSGNGGFVEVSGKNYLEFQGTVNTLAPNGVAGTLLLDPTNITIISGSGSFTALTQIDQFADPNSGANTINAALINAATSNVTLQATGNINFSAPVTMGNAGVGLSAEANNNINVNANITTNGGNITLRANADNINGGALAINNATINTNGGDFVGVGRGNAGTARGININNSVVNVANGNINLSGTGGTTASSNIGIFISNSVLQTTGTGNITLSGIGGNGTGASNRGINIQTNSSLTAGGNLTLTGTGGNGTTDLPGIFLSGNSTLSTATGDITLTGIGGNGTGNSNRGINIQTNSSLTAAGNLTLTGTGGNSTGNLNDGINIQTNSSLTASGNLTLTGNGGKGTANIAGIFLSGNSTLSTATGDITLTGTGGNGTGNLNRGISFGTGASVTAFGNLTLTGTGGSGTNELQGIVLNSNSTLSTATGDITLTGTGGNGTGNLNYGISFGTDSAVTAFGNLTLTGTGGTGLDGLTGIFLSGNSTLSTATGDITLTGTGGNGTGNLNYGIGIQTNSAVTTGGNLTLTGTGGTGLDGLTGIFLSGNSTLSTATGDITLTGTGGNGTGNLNYGIGIQTNSAVTTGGNLTLTGTGGTGLDGLTGIFLSGNSTLSTATGDITLTGTGGNGTGNLNRGIGIQTNSAVTTGGNLTLTGTGGTGLDGLTGIFLSGNSTLSTATGDITLTGTGGNGTGNLNYGIGIQTNSAVTAFGNLTLTGTGGTGTNELQGIRLAGNSKLESTVGNISLRGIGTNGNAGLLLDSGQINTIPGTLTLEAERIEIKGNTTISGTNTLQFSPLENTGNLTLDIETPTFIQPGFSHIYIGQSDGSGMIALSGNVTFSNPVTLQSPQGTGSINTTASNITGAGNATITFNAGNQIVTGNITNAGRNITLMGNTVDTTAGLLDTSSTTGSGGAITLQAATGLQTSTINTSTTALDPTTTAGTVTLDAGTGNIVLTGNINASATAGSGSSITFAQPVILAQPATTLTTSGGTSSSAITFQNTLNGSGSNPDLTLNTGTADIRFFESIGSTNPLGNLTLNTTGNAIFSRPATFTSLTANANDTQLAGDLTTTGPNGMSFGNRVTLTGDITLKGDWISWNGAVSGTGNLTLQPYTPDSEITLGNSTGSGLSLSGTQLNLIETGFNSVTITTNGSGNITTTESLTFNSPAILQAAGGSITVGNSITGNYNTSLTFNANSANLNSEIKTAGNFITFNSDVFLANPTALLSNGGNITFNGTVNGANNLTLNSGTGTTLFNQAVGAGIPIGNGTGPALTSASTGATIFNSTLTGNSGIIATGPVTFQENVTLRQGDTATNLTADLSLAGITFDAANGATFGNVTLTEGPVTILATNNSITFTGTLNGNYPLTLNAGAGNLTFQGAVGNANPLTRLEATSLNLFANSTLNVAGDIALTATETINLQGTVTTTNNGKLTLANTGNLTLASPVNLDGSFNQTGSGAVFLNNPITTTNDNITFTGPVTLNAPVTFSLGNATIAFNSSLVAGNNPLTLTAGEVNFGGVVSGSSTLVLQPTELNQDIAIGGLDNNTDAFELTASEISALQNGFSEIIIGRIQSSGNINLINPVTFSDPLTLQTGTGTLNVNSPLTGIDNASLTLKATTLNLAAGLTTANNPISLTGSVNLNNPITLNSSGGNITVTGTINGNNSLNLEAGTGQLQLQSDIGQTSPLSRLTINAGTTNLSGNVTTANGDITLNSAVVLGKDATFNTGNGNIILGNTLDSRPGNYSLNLIAGRGNIRFNGDVGSTGPLGNLTLESGSTLTATSTINTLGRFQATTTETVDLQGNVTAGSVDITTNNQLSVSNITANGGIRLLSNTGDVVAGDLNAASLTGSGGVISLTSSLGTVTAGNLTTSGVTQGGDITVIARLAITAGQLDSSATIGSGGNVFLDPIGDIQVEFINAQGGSSGRGGDIFAETTGGFFRATGSFATAFSPTGRASISAAGGAGGGNITIKHPNGDGGPPIRLFEVGNGSVNGTAAAITNGQFTINGQSFPGSFSIGNIAIITDDAIPPVTPTPSPAPTTTPISLSTPSPTPAPLPVAFADPTPTLPPEVPTLSPTPNAPPAIPPEVSALTSAPILIAIPSLPRQLSRPSLPPPPPLPPTPEPISLPPLRPPLVLPTPMLSLPVVTPTPPQLVLKPLPTPLNTLVLTTALATANTTLIAELTSETSTQNTYFSLDDFQRRRMEPLELPGFAPSSVLQIDESIVQSWPRDSIVRSQFGQFTASSVHRNSHASEVIASEEQLSLVCEKSAAGENSAPSRTQSSQPSGANINLASVECDSVAAGSQTSNSVSSESQNLSSNMARQLSKDKQEELEGRGTTNSATLMSQTSSLETAEQLPSLSQNRTATVGSSATLQLSIPELNSTVLSRQFENKLAGETLENETSHQQVLRAESRYLALSEPETARTPAPGSRNTQSSHTELEALTPDAPETLSGQRRYNFVLGYGSAADRIFASDEIEETVWRIEQARNLEFEEHLGINPYFPNLTQMQLNGIQERLKASEVETQKRSVVIYMLARTEQLELIVVPALGKPLRYRVPQAKKEILFSAVKEFRAEITNPIRQGSDRYKMSARQLYQWMIHPLEKDLQKLGVDTLLLSVDPGLRSLPFAALYDGQQFLIEKYSLSLIPSFSLTDSRYTSVAGATVLAMGASEFSDKKPLPAVPLELRMILSQWPGIAFLNAEFTLENLKQQRLQQAFRVIHLATHADFEPGNFKNSYIQLWNEPLHFSEMETLDWYNPPVDLLVLSACRTALGDREAELGFAGLALQTGAKSVLASLWNVDDDGTLSLMNQFYEQLRTVTFKADALRSAQLAMIQGQVKLRPEVLRQMAGEWPVPNSLLNEQFPDFSHPYFWSGFTLIGNPW